MSGKSAQKQRNSEETTTETHGTEEAVQATQESLDKVRDILFGAQIRDQDRRFSGFEERLAADFASFRDEVRKNLSSIEEFVKSEVSALVARITTESNQRTEASNALANELRGTAQRLEQRIQEFDQQHAGAESDVRKHLADQSNAMREELKATHAELHAVIEKVGADLKNAKTDRTALAGMFHEMASRLQG